MRIFATIAIFASFLFAPPALAQETDLGTPAENTFLQGKVLEILYQEEVNEFGQEIVVQRVQVQIRTGEEAGKEMELKYETANRAGSRLLEPGDRIVIGKQVYGEDIMYGISDIYRVNALWMILALFFVLVLVFVGKRGVRAFVGLALSLAVVILFLVPQILDGANPFWISFVSTIGIASTALFVAHGISLRTTVAFFATLLTIGLSLIIASLFVSMTRLTGLGTEEAFYLQFADVEPINLAGLLLGGLVIGTLGVLDDITTAQAAAVEEIHKANTKLSARDLFTRGGSVGREHIISLVNTLVLAYVGTSLPLILLFSIFPQPLWVTLNSEVVMEEIVRMLVGSSALILAVPITTALAASMLAGPGKKLRDRFGRSRWFALSKETHVHHH